MIPVMNASIAVARPPGASTVTSKSQEKKMIYLDYNATTPLCDQAREAMLPYLDRHFGNPSSVHAAGREARARDR